MLVVLCARERLESGIQLAERGSAVGLRVELLAQYPGLEVCADGVVVWRTLVYAVDVAVEEVDEVLEGGEGSVGDFHRGDRWVFAGSAEIVGVTDQGGGLDGPGSLRGGRGVDGDLGDGAVTDMSVLLDSDCLPFGLPFAGRR